MTTQVGSSLLQLVSEMQDRKKFQELNWAPDLEPRKLGTPEPDPELGTRNPTRNPEPDPELGTRNPTWNPEPGTRNRTGQTSISTSAAASSGISSSWCPTSE